jgi:AraC-like DNA-binding protein
MRIEEAKRLLLDTEQPVWEISRAVGYQHTSNFCIEFKRVTGFQPGVYRKVAPKRKSY